MRSQTRARAAENGAPLKESWLTVVGATLLMIAAAVLFSSCGGEEASAEDATAGERVAFGDFDADGSGDLNEDEFYGGVYEDWDANDDGYVDEKEFGTGVGTYYDDYDYAEYGDYNEWDADNNDDELDEEEFDASVTDTGVYDEWDADGNDAIERSEFNEAV